MKRLSGVGRNTLIVAGIMVSGTCAFRAPASLLSLVLPAAIQLKNVEGSLWNGEAAAVGVGGLLVQERVGWRFQPHSLLAGQLEWVIGGRYADQASRLKLSVHWRGAELSDVGLFLPLEPFVALHPRLKSAQLGGTLHATVKSWSPHVPTTLSIQVRHLFSRVMPQGEFGNYRLEVKAGTDGRGDWQVSTVDGELHVAGEGAFDAGRENVTGRVLVTPRGAMPWLSPALAALPRSGESYSIEFQ